MFGRICRRTMRQAGAPTMRAAATKSADFSDPNLGVDDARYLHPAGEADHQRD